MTEGLRDIKEMCYITSPLNLDKKRFEVEVEIDDKWLEDELWELFLSGYKADEVEKIEYNLGFNNPLIISPPKELIDRVWGRFLREIKLAGNKSPLTLKYWLRAEEAKRKQRRAKCS